MKARWPRVRRFGDAAVLVEVAARPGVRTARRVASLARALEGLTGVLDVTPGATSVLVEGGELVMIQQVAAAAIAGPDDPTDSRSWVIPVRFGGDDGPDLAESAALAGLTADALVALLVGVDLTVGFVGFSPGFPYLLGLPRRLALPRLATPRLRVPAGSVALAGGWLGIYPSATPGGWRIVGRTNQPLFGADWTPPARFAAGDRVRLVAG
ncbi:MAG: allophanate hydrolase subunit 1 [Dehalococcoidia bacterium]